MGKISFQWAAGCCVLALSGAFGNYLAEPRQPGAGYLAAHASFTVVLGLAFAVFCLVYAGLERAGRLDRRARFGQLHTAATLLGVAMMLSPALLIPIVEARMLATSQGWTLVEEVAVAGYALTLLAQGLFVPVLLDAFRRRAELR